LCTTQFASGPKSKDSWADEFKGGGCCETFFLAGTGDDDDDFTSGCNRANAFVCGNLIMADRVGNMPVLKAQRCEAVACFGPLCKGTTFFCEPWLHLAFPFS